VCRDLCSHLKSGCYGLCGAHHSLNGHSLRPCPATGLDTIPYLVHMYRPPRRLKRIAKPSTGYIPLPLLLGLLTQRNNSLVPSHHIGDVPHAIALVHLIPLQQRPGIVQLHPRAGGQLIRAPAVPCRQRQDVRHCLAQLCFAGNALAVLQNMCLRKGYVILQLPEHPSNWVPDVRPHPQWEGIFSPVSFPGGGREVIRRHIMSPETCKAAAADDVAGDEV